LSKDLKNSISKLLKESSQFNTNDVLVHTDLAHPKLFRVEGSLEFSLAEFPKKILQEADKTIKESGVNPLCLAEEFLELNLGDKKVNAPIFLTPLNKQLNKVQQLVRFDRLDDDLFINPFISFQLDQLGVKLEQLEKGQILDKEHILNQLKAAGFNYSVPGIGLIGSFHHHRFQVIKELEDLLSAEVISPQIAELLGYGQQQPVALDLPSDVLLPFDVDHNAVFSEFSQRDLVVQGPPGTGKSQVLSNVVSKLLASGHTSIFISEKRAALEVICKKLSVFGLDKLCFIATSDSLSHTFLQELKSTWDYLENYQSIPINNMRLSEQYVDNLQMTLDLLTQDKLIGGVSFHEFKALSSSKQIEKGTYNGSVPSIPDFQLQKKILEQIYANNLHELLGSMKSTTVHREDFDQLDLQIDHWIEQLQQLGKLFELRTWGDLTLAMKEALQCQIFENDLYKKYAAVFRPNSRAQKRFISLRKKYLAAKIDVESLEQTHSHWKVIPSEEEAQSMLRNLESGGLLRKRKARKRWNQISFLPFEDALETLHARLQEIKKIKALSQIKIKFCDLGIEDVENDVPLIQQTLLLFSQDQWHLLERIPAEKRSLLTNSHGDINNLYQDLKTHFSFNEDLALETYLTLLKKRFGDILSLRKAISKLSKDQLSLLSICESFASYELVILNSHWVQFKEHFPAFAQFSVQQLYDKVNNIIESQDAEAQMFARSIQNDLYLRFQAYHELLNTPARKLSEKQKALKAELRKGKSLLVKEFGKTRSHPTLRELFNSEARKWIQLLKPIWLSNPTQLAKCFPMEEHMFDVAIFDEASQIPLQNALGAIQRSRRVLIAGDEHQMGPSNYFKTGSTDVVDLLHQANYHWKRVALNHHYRSQHPDLIAFSNRHFYEGKLAAFPAAKSETPIIHHYLKNGIFTDSKNEHEAKMVASHIESYLGKSHSIGVVAFSEEQLTCIQDHLSPKAKQHFSQLQGEHLSFFKSLENVQGDECDHLIISFGYAKNEDGEFHMRFGPMNTANGRKRLNVLLTRAIKSIHFFCSVQSSDFKLSDNESVNLLRQWISWSEHYTPKNEFLFPFGIQPDQHTTSLNFDRIHEKLPTAQELVTLQRVLLSRNWAITYN